MPTFILKKFKGSYCKVVRIWNGAREEGLCNPALNWKGHGPGTSTGPDTEQVLRKCLVTERINEPMG